jgi:hypothetical protein
MWMFADHAAIKKDGSGTGTTYVQSTGEDIQNHVRKMLEGGTYQSGKKKGQTFGPNEYLSPILKQGNQVFLWAWRKRQDVGKRKTWQMKEYEFILKDGIVVCQETQRNEA